MVRLHVPFLTTLCDPQCGHFGLIILMRSFSLSSNSICGILLIYNEEEASNDEKSSSDDDILLNSL